MKMKKIKKLTAVLSIVMAASAISTPLTAFAVPANPPKAVYELMGTTKDGRIMAIDLEEQTTAEHGSFKNVSDSYYGCDANSKGNLYASAGDDNEQYLKYSMPLKNVAIDIENITELLGVDEYYYDISVDEKNNKLYAVGDIKSNPTLFCYDLDTKERIMWLNVSKYTDSVAGVCVDAKGIVWLCSQTGELLRYTPAALLEPGQGPKDSFTKYPDFFVPFATEEGCRNDVSLTCDLKTGNFYMMTNSGKDGSISYVYEFSSAWQLQKRARVSETLTSVFLMFTGYKADETPVDPVDPTPVDPTPVDPTPVDPTPVDPTPVDPTPVDPTPVDPVEPADNLTTTYVINQWGEEHQVLFTISNKTDKAFENWKLEVNKNDVTISTGWNVTIKEEGDYYVITPVEWNSVIAPGQSVEFGVQGKGTVKDTIEVLTNGKGNDVTEPDPIDPTPVEPTPVAPTPVDPTPVEPTPVDPTPVEPSGDVIALKSAAFAKAIDLSAYDYKNIKQIVVKFSGEATQFSGAVVLGEWIQQDSYDNNNVANNTLTIDVKYAQSVLTIYKWWSNTTLEIAEIELVF